MALNPGDTLGGYRLIRIVGEGGMGVVWEAEQTSLDRLVALKVVRPEFAAEAEYRERFQNEARIAAALDHGNVVTVFDSGEAAGHLFLSMALVEGPSVRQLLDTQGSVTPKRAVAITAEVAAGLAAAHAAGLVHRDVKPSNILLSVDLGLALITDFGIARANDATRATSTGQIVGSLAYMAPEQIQGGNVDSRADVYSLGAVLHELLTGRAPFARENHAATMWAQVHEPPPKPSEHSGVPEALDAVVAKAMAKIPSARYPTTVELAEAAALAVGSDATEVTRIAPVVDWLTTDVPGEWQQTRVDLRSRRGGGRHEVPVAGAAAAGPQNASGNRNPSRSKGTSARRAAVVVGALALGALAGGGGAMAVPGLLKPKTTVSTAVSVSTETSTETTSETVTSTESAAPWSAAPSDSTTTTDSADAASSGDWPGGSGYTAIIESTDSVAKANEVKTQAIDAGLDAGLLYSSDYGSLNPGYWVVFSGDFQTASEANSRVSDAKDLGFDGAYPRFVRP